MDDDPGSDPPTGPEPGSGSRGIGGRWLVTAVVLLPLAVVAALLWVRSAPGSEERVGAPRVDERWRDGQSRRGR